MVLTVLGYPDTTRGVVETMCVPVHTCGGQKKLTGAVTLCLSFRGKICPEPGVCVFLAGLAATSSRSSFLSFLWSRDYMYGPETRIDMYTGNLTWVLWKSCKCS